MSTSEDGISQTNKKRKHNRRRIWRLFRFCNTKNQYKHDEFEVRGGTSSVEGIPVNSSMSGDQASLGASSRGDAITIGSMPSESAVLGAACLVVTDDRIAGKQELAAPIEPTQLECPLCMISQPVENFPRLMTCHHRSCIDCLRQYLMIEITESRVNLACPECQEKIHPVDMQVILKNSPHLIEKWEEFTLRRCLSVDPDCRWCPAPDCGFAVIATGCASCPKIHCDRPSCDTDFCYHCRQEWHPDQTCDSAHLQRTKKLRLRGNSVSYTHGPSSNDQIKPCPKCGVAIAKMNDGSCNHMTCMVCEAEFCWLCLQEITDLHYLSPSGCTFWGKKPWSRKKKILWQLGLLIGAPLGIGLVAGVAVPAIIIGLPIWVARRVMARLADKSISKHKRNGLVAISVIIAILTSPILAALAVGIGVPVMLLYVYGVVPFSLCRTGSYGLTARNAAGRARSAMRIDLGSPVVPAVSRGHVSYDTTSLPGRTNANGIRQTIANPSIGEASVGGLTMASLTESHASAADRIDGDVASTTAIAGTSITGSINGSMAATSIDTANGRLKEGEQTSSNMGPNSAVVTSVQVHMQDNVSVHSTSSYAPSTGSNISKTFSSKSLRAKRKSNKAGKISGTRKSAMPKKISEQEETKSQNVSALISTKQSETLSSESSPDANDASLTLASELRGKPVIVEIEKGDKTVMLKVHTDDSTSTSSMASSCGSQNALLEQAATTNKASPAPNAAAVIKKDSISISDEVASSKKPKKQGGKK